jgi:hypothetical protein
LVENQKLLKTLIFPCPSAVALHTPATANLRLHICVVPVLPVEAQISKKNSGNSLSLKHNYYYGTHQNQVVQSFNPGLQLKFLRYLTCNCLKLGVV